ncbi:MAG: hypothetical protein OXU23_13890 [Candidatus Poribacteria bacterium]|nr:hypothetical protein [Candidatus Poribacteria bacterium]
MKQYSRFITLTGGILAFFSFALPWKHIYSGAMLANGRGWPITLAFIASSIVVGIGYFVLSQKSRDNPRLITLGLIMSGLGLLCWVVTLIQFLESRINFITISFVASLIIIGITIYTLNRQTPWKSIPTKLLLISSSVGLICFFILFFSGSLAIGSGNRVDNTRYGASLSAIGYILAMVGLLCFPKSNEE